MNDYLPGMENLEAKPKAPHEMHPDEFAAHPYAVFHAAPEGTDMSVRKTIQETPGAEMHAGTERAAHERILWQGQRELHYKDKIGEYPSRIHTMWAVPREGELDNVYGDTSNAAMPAKTGEEKPLPYNYRPEEGLGYYRNQIEHHGSTSVATGQPQSRFKTQSDYVKEAIDSGKEHEVHPVTLGLYRMGHLDAGTKFNYNQAQAVYSVAHDNPDMQPTGQMMFHFPLSDEEQASARKAGKKKFYTDYPDDASFHEVTPEGGLGRHIAPGDVRKSGEEGSALIQYADAHRGNVAAHEVVRAQRGPDLDRLRAQYRQDHGKI